MTKAQVDAGRRYNGDKNKSISRYRVRYAIGVHPKLNNPIPRTEQSLELMLAGKVSKRSKKDLRGLWETLASGSTVMRTSPITTVIKEPGVPEVKVRNSDIAKFGTRVLVKATPNFGNMLSNVHSLMIKQQTKRSPNTLKISRKSIGEKSRFDTARHSLTLLMAYPRPIATFPKPCPPESPRSLKRGEIAHVNRL